MSSSGKIRVLLQMAVMGSAFVAVGYGTMKVVTPTPDESYAALAPDLRRKVDANRAARLASEHEHELINPDPENAKPVWADARR